VAWASELKPTAPVAPPKLRVMILPFDWHVVMSDANEAQFGSAVPGKVALSVGLQVCEASDIKNQVVRVHTYVGQIHRWGTPGSEENVHK